MVEISDIRTLMIKVCRTSGVPDGGIDIVVDHYLDGELRGRSTHGVAKFCFESQFFPERQGDPFVTRDHGAVAVVDGNRGIGPLNAAFAVDLVSDKAREFGIGLVGLINTQRYGILGTWTEALAQRGLLGIAMNTSTADSTTPGHSTPFLGVNPLSFAVATESVPMVADMSTTMAPMGNLWNARRGLADLAPGSFVDGEGEVTDDPHEALSALVFGGHKGFTVSLLVQFVTGSVFGFPMGDRVTSVWETGYAFLAVSPAGPGGPAAFRGANSAFLEGIQKIGVRTPGSDSREAGELARRRGTVELTDTVYRELRQLAGAGSPGSGTG